MKTPFRISQNDTVKAMIFNSDDKLLASVYDSGFTTIEQVKNTLKQKLNDYNKSSKKFTYSITNEDKQTYWSNR